MKDWAVYACLLWLMLMNGGCAAVAGQQAAPPPGAEVVVFAAASLTDAFTQIGAAFEQANPPNRVIFNFAGSQQLAGQLEQGAQADLFASADSRQMEAAVEAERVAPSGGVAFACNRLVVVSSSPNVTELRHLAQPGLKIIVGAESVPVGAYTQAFLAAAGADPAYGEAFRAGVLANVVSYEQNVRAVLSKVRLGEADAGVVYATDALTAPDVERVEIPAPLNQSADYFIAPVLDGDAPVLAQAFVDLLAGPAGREALVAAGFSVDCPGRDGQRQP